MSGQGALYSLVEAYAALGEHRTGTDVDRLTTEWYSETLCDLGATVTHDPFEFRYYNQDVTLTVNGEETPALALYYEWVGRCRSDSIASYAVAAHCDEHSITAALARIAADGIEPSATKLIATQSSSGELVALNRIPKHAVGLPTVLVAGSLADRLEESHITLDMAASTCPGRSRNIAARFGSGTASPLVITTPITGWFTCAGERGTGLALVPELARQLSEFAPVLLVVTAGHELGYWGGWHYAQRYPGPPRAVLHIGSCVAASGATSRTEDMHLTSLMTTTNLTGERLRRVQETVEQIGVEQVRQPLSPRKSGEWVGESECWANHACPMISLAGDSPQFHTRRDLAANVTNEALLEKSFEALLTLGRILTAPPSGHANL